MLQKTDLTRFPSARANRALFRSGRRPKLLRHALRLLAFILILAVVAVGGLAVMLMNGPVEFGFLRSQVSAAIARQLGPDYRTEVGRVYLAIDPVLGLALEIDNVEIADRSGDAVASLPSTRIALDALAPFTARSLVRSVELGQPRLAFVRGDGQVYLGTQRTPPPAPRPAAGGAEPAAGADTRGFAGLRAAFELLDLGLDRPIRGAAGAGFRRLSMVEGTVEVWDAELKEQRSFTRTDLTVSIDASGNELTASLAAAGYSGRWTVSAERSVDPRSGARTLTASFSQLTLPDLVPALARGDGFRSDIPIYGRATAELSAAGEVTDASIRIDLGAGNLLFGPKDSMLLDEGSLRLHWNVAGDQLVIEPSPFFFGEGRGILTGTVMPAGDRRYAFSLESRGAVLAPRDSGAPPLLTDRIAAAGSVDLARRLVTIDNAVLTSRSGSVTASGSIGLEARSPSLAMAASTTPMDAATLKQVWPPMIAGDARRWVLANVISGRISAARFEAAVPSGYLWDPERRPIPEDAMRLDVRLEDVSFRPFGDLPPVTEATGNFALAGSTLGVDIEKGKVVTPSGETVTINAGAFAIPNTAARPADAHVVLDVAGSARGLAEIADARPFRALTRTGIDPAALSGTASATTSAGWPLRGNLTDGDVDWRVTVEAKDLASSQPIEGRSIADGDLVITATQDQVQIRGTAEVDGGTLALDMVQPMREGAGGDDDRRLRVTLDEKARQRLGIGLDDVIGGTVGATLSSLPDGAGQHYEIDLTRARLVLTSLGWSKGIGVPADLAFDLLPGEGGGHRLENIAVTGDGFGFSGSAVLDGDYGVVSADIEDFSLRKGDSVDFRLTRTKGGYRISAHAGEFDARGLIAHIRAAAETPSTAPDISIDARVDRLIGFNQETVDNASILVEAQAGAVQDLEFAGAMAGTPISASYTEQGGGAVLDMTVGDAGRFLRFADLYTRIRGGALRIVGRRTSEEGPLAGTFDVAAFNIVGEPAMERLVTVSTAETGRTGLDPDNVAFDRMALNFTLRGSTIVIDDALLKGSAVGATFSGAFDFAADRIALTGTYLPAYSFNNMFGRLPIIGLALGAGDREGLLGVTFKIDGAITAPRLQVNPLSAIAPGIFRKIFEFQ